MQAQNPQHFGPLQKAEASTEFVESVLIGLAKRGSCGATYIDYVAWAWPLHLHAPSSLVTWLPVSHPLYHRGSIVGNRPYFGVSDVSLHCAA